MTPTVLIILLAFPFALIGWRLGVMRFYRRPEPESVMVRCDDGWQLRLYRTRPKQRRYLEPVVLCHGLANNHRFLTFQLATALADVGFEVFAVDLRGILNSAAPPPGHRRDVTIDDMIAYDVPAIMRGVCELSIAEKAIWVGHSMGGMVVLGAATTELGSRLKAIATLGTPVYFRLRLLTRLLLRLGPLLALPWKFHLEWLTPLIAPLAGWFSVPGASGVANQRNLEGRQARATLALAIGPIWKGVLRQLSDCVKHDVFRSLDGSIDYRQRIASITAPMLVMGGDADLIAPPESQKKLFELATAAQDKTLVLFGTARGDRWDYGHGDLVIGSAVQKEVYPQLIPWLQARATPMSGLEA